MSLLPLTSLSSPLTPRPHLTAGSVAPALCPRTPQAYPLATARLGLARQRPLSLPAPSTLSPPQTNLNWGDGYNFLLLLL